MRAPLVLMATLLVASLGCGDNDGPEELDVGDSVYTGDGQGDGPGAGDGDAPPPTDGDPQGSDGDPMGADGFGDAGDLDFGDFDAGDFDVGDFDLGDFDLGDGGFDSDSTCGWLLEQCAGGQSWACTAAESAGCAVGGDT